MEIDTTPPLNFENCIVDAEDACLRKICEIVGLVYGRTGFAGVKSDNAVECGVFDIGRPESPEHFGFPSGTFHFRGQLDLYHRNRQELQRWCARLICAMPIQTTQSTGVKMPEGSNVEQFRIAPTGVPMNDITTIELPVGTASEDNTVEVFTTAVFFDIIFTAGTRVQA